MGQGYLSYVSYTARVNGDQPSNPGSNPQTLSASDYRDAGHIDVRRAVRELSD